MNTLILKTQPLLLFLLLQGVLSAQPIGTTAGSVTSCPGEIQVPIDVTNCNGIGAISLMLIFDNSKLTYIGYQNLNSALTVGMLIINSTGNKVVISWVNTTAANLGNNTLVELRFNSITSITNLSWDILIPGNCEYTDVNGNILPASFSNGTAIINQPPVIITQPVDMTIPVGQNTSFVCSAFGSGIAYLWQLNVNGGNTWSDLTNNSIYSGVTTTTLNVTDALLIYSGYKYRCRLSGTCPPVGYTNIVTMFVLEVPATQALQDSTIISGQTVCYDATQTITVAGNGMIFIVQNGGSATMIAGQNILYYPGTVVVSGGYLHGTISKNSTYCGAKSTSIVTNATPSVDIHNDRTDSFFKIYPNPTSGIFMLELLKNYGNIPIYIEILGIYGEHITSETFIGLKTHEFSLSGKPAGMYLIHVTCGNQSEMKKILK